MADTAVGLDFDAALALSGASSEERLLEGLRRGDESAFEVLIRDYEHPVFNLVSRLEGLCRPLGRWVLISGTVAAEVATPLVPLGEHALRGIAAPCAVFTLPDR